MFDWCETMQHKAMHGIFCKGQSNDTTDEKHSVRTHSELRNCQQDDCEQGRYQHFAEIDDGGHGPIRGAALSDAPPRANSGDVKRQLSNPPYPPMIMVLRRACSAISQPI